MEHTGKSEAIIQDVAGCGPFHVISYLLLILLTRQAAVMTMSFMAFGILNPGWRCLDHDNSTTPITSTPGNSPLVNAEDVSSGIGVTANASSDQFVLDDCPVYRSCQNVQFHPSTSTIVSEWGLLCDKAWIANMCITVQMAGLILGVSITGVLGNALGRKTTIYGGQLLLALTTIVATFSNSWQMFMVLRFFLGLSSSTSITMTVVYVGEILPRKWRPIALAFPMWDVSVILFGGVLMALKDWRQIHVCTAVIAVVGFLPVFWVPESLRWLETKNKKEKFERVARKLVKTNRRPTPSLEDVTLTDDVSTEKEEPTVRRYTYLDLYRRGYFCYTVVLNFLHFSADLWFYTLFLGIKVLHGDFYTNFIAITAIALPFCVFPMVAPNYLGRKWSAFALAALAAVCLLTAGGFRMSGDPDLKTIGATTMIFIATVPVNLIYSVIEVIVTELYPTVVRSEGANCHNFCSQIGSLVAPFLIPSQAEEVHITYLSIGAVGVLCCVAVFALPETKGRPMRETFEQDLAAVLGDEESERCKLCP